MLERQLELEGGLTVCRLGALCPDGGQALECALRLEGVLPGRRVAVRVEAELSTTVMDSAQAASYSSWVI